MIDINESTIKGFVDKLRPQDPEIRKKLDFGYSYDGKIVLLFEIRPIWNNPEKLHNMEFAKIRYVKSSGVWYLYWMRASGKWELYEPSPSFDYLQAALSVIEKDQFGAFFG